MTCTIRGFGEPPGDFGTGEGIRPGYAAKVAGGAGTTTTIDDIGGTSESRAKDRCEDERLSVSSPALGDVLGEVLGEALGEATGTEALRTGDCAITKLVVCRTWAKRCGPMNWRFGLFCCWMLLVPSRWKLPSWMPLVPC